MKTLKKFENFVNERKTTDEEKEVFLYLNDLRDSGVVNMFGATPYISDEFGLGKRESQKLLNLWMKNYNNDGDYDEINEKKAEYTRAEWKKDGVRIGDIVEKAEERAAKNGTSVDYEKMKLATTQANRIKKYIKAKNRGETAQGAGEDEISKIFFNRANAIEKEKNMQKRNESSEYGGQESGKITLTVNGGSPTTWYYLSDAIQNGLLEETLEIDDFILEEYANDKNIDYLDIDDLTDMLIEDFEEELGNLLEYLIRIDYLGQDISSVSIEGEDEDGEYHELDFFLE